jgi:sialate O-acetylesterase
MKSVSINMLRIACLAAAALTALTSAKVVLPALIGDNMVLQRDAYVNVWGKADAGEDVCVSVGWQDERLECVADNDGNWKLRVKTPSDKGPYSITVGCEEPITLNNILIGEVWVCSGQSNMGFGLRSCDTADADVPNADYPQIRFFGVNQVLADEPRQDCEGKWLVCKPDVAAWHSGVAYYFAQKLHTSADIPVGIIQAAVGGTPADSWMSEEVLLSQPETAVSVERYNELMKSYPARYADYEKQLAKWQEISDNPASKPRVPMGPEHFQRPCGFWNAMISPLLNFRIAGVLWYQGEGNSWRAEQYRKMFPMLITSWRQNWKQGDFPFYYVQIAPYEYEPPFIAAELRQAQLETLSIANTAMVCTMDIGDNKDIHPRNKKDVGYRLANIALNRIYHKAVQADAPIYAGMRIEDGGIRIYFSNADNGLELRGSGEYFEIAGEDGRYVTAKAVVEGDTVVVSSEEATQPQNVRYGWSNTAGASLFSVEGLAAFPFRTDNTLWTTEGKQTYF